MSLSVSSGSAGAGDGFVAGLLSGIANDAKVLDDDRALTELCRFANAVGALTTTARGAIPSLPTTRQVNALLSREQGSDYTHGI